MFSTAADGSGETRRLIAGEPDQRPFEWTPDGETLAFQEFSPETGWDIRLLSADGKSAPRPFLQTSANERYPAFSPNGHWMAYGSDESGREEIYICPFPQGEPKRQVSIDGGGAPRWNPNGRELYFRTGNAMMAINVETESALVLGKPRLLFESDSYRGGSRAYDVSADGSRFIMIDRSQSPPPPTALVFVHNWAEELKRLVPTDN